jgi:hypothetical protein
VLWRNYKSHRYSTRSCPVSAAVAAYVFEYVLRPREAFRHTGRSGPSLSQGLYFLVTASQRMTFSQVMGVARSPKLRRLNQMFVAPALRGLEHVVS